MTVATLFYSILLGSGRRGPLPTSSLCAIQAADGCMSCAIGMRQWCGTGGRLTACARLLAAAYSSAALVAFTWWVLPTGSVQVARSVATCLSSVVDLWAAARG